MGTRDGEIGQGDIPEAIPPSQAQGLPGDSEKNAVMELIKVKWEHIKSMRDMGVDTKEAEGLFSQARKAFKSGDYALAKEGVSKALDGVDKAFKDFKKRMERELKEDKRKDYYEILGVPRTATKGEIKKAYYKRIQEYHPDKVAALGPKLKSVAEKEAKLINEAYGTLSDDDKRAEYDQTLGE